MLLNKLQDREFFFFSVPAQVVRQVFKVEFFPLFFLVGRFVLVATNVFSRYC